jgi:hypothetical protein
MANLKYNYKQYETPEERLRNKLQPFWFLVELAQNSKDEDIKNAANMCEEVFDDIHSLLSDIEPFYNNPMRIAPNLTYRSLGDTSIEGGLTMYSLPDGNLSFVQQDETPTMYKSIIGRDGIMEMQIIAGENEWWKGPHLLVFVHKLQEKKKDDPKIDYFWDNDTYLRNLGDALIAGKDTFEVEDFRQFCEEHEVRFSEMVKEYVWLYKQSIIYNFW